MSSGRIRSLFNYLCGSEVDDSDEYRRSTHGGGGGARSNCVNCESLKTFLRYTFRITSKLFPSLLAPSTLAFFALLADVIVLEVVVYRVGLLSGRYYKCLSDQDLPAFWHLTLIAVLYIIVNSILKSIKDFLASLLSIMWRKQLTQSLHKMYFTRMRFYYLQMNGSGSGTSGGCGVAAGSQETTATNPTTTDDSTACVQPLNLDFNADRLDNPDQRITQDVNSLCVSLSSIIPLLIITPFVIGWYGYQVRNGFLFNIYDSLFNFSILKAYKTVGISGIGAVVGYFLFWGLINGPLTAPIARVVYKQDKKEGDFR